MPILLRFLLIAVVSLAALPPATAGTLDEAKKAGYIRVGFANEAPFGYATASGKLTGEAPEIAKAVFAKMGIKEVDGVLTEWSSLIPGLKARRFDVIAAGMFITPPRCEQVLFSEPTYRLGQSFLVRKGNPKKLHSYADVAKNDGIKLGVMAGAVERGYARDAGIPDDRVIELPDQVAMLAAVRAGRVDAGALTALSVERMARKGSSRVERAMPFETPEKAIGYGAFAFRKEDSGLVAEFNKHLKAFVGTPAHQKLVGAFGFTKTELPGDTTAAYLCSKKK